MILSLMEQYPERLDDLFQALADPTRRAVLGRLGKGPASISELAKPFDMALPSFMSGPDGGESDNPGVFLEVVPMERIVWTSMLVAGWRPATPWLAMTGIFTLADEGSGTRYTARCLHKDDADRKKHEDTGFFEGWGTMIQQMEEVAQSLP